MNPLEKLPHDKALHVIAGLLVALVGYAAAYAASVPLPEVVGIVGAVGAGIGKEISDRGNPGRTACYADAAATIAGGVLAMLPSLTRYLA